MYDVIASSFFQKKFCRLPGIGSLELVTLPAEYDFSNKQIKAPQQKIIFIRSSSTDHVFNEFSAISQLLKERLNSGETVDVAGMGAFSKDSSGINFVPAPVNEDLFQPVAAEKVIHKDAEHAILVGDKETTNVEMTEYYTETEATKDNWWIYAIVLAAAGLAILGYHLSQHGFNNLAG